MNRNDFLFYILKSGNCPFCRCPFDSNEYGDSDWQNYEQNTEDQNGENDSENIDVNSIDRFDLLQQFVTGGEVGDENNSDQTACTDEASSIDSKSESNDDD